jgi:hypothetical protein
LVAASKGLGFRLQLYTGLFNTTGAIAVIFILMVMMSGMAGWDVAHLRKIFVSRAFSSRERRDPANKVTFRAGARGCPALLLPSSVANNRKEGVPVTGAGACVGESPLQPPRRQGRQGQVKLLGALAVQRPSETQTARRQDRPSGVDKVTTRDYHELI